MYKLASYFRRLATAVLLVSLLISTTPLDLVEKTSAVWCGTFSPVYVDTAAGVDRAGCWGYDSAHPYKTIQAGTNHRWSLYTGIDTSSVVYFKDKRAGATEIVDNTGRFPFLIVPWTAGDTLSTTLDLRGQNLTVGDSGKGFKFTGGGVRFYTGTLSGMDVQYNSFTNGSAVRIRGARYYGTSYSNNISLYKNSFNNAEISVEGNEGWFDSYQNTFSGTVPADNDWLEVWDSSNVNVLGNKSTGGRAATIDGSSGVIVMSNTHNGNGADYGFFSYGSTGAEFDNNTISNVYTGIGIVNGNYNYIENNKINLYSLYSSMSLTRGIEIVNSTINEIHHNTLSYSTDGIVQELGSVSKVYNNSFYTHSNDALRLQGVDAGKIYTNTVDAAGKGIYGIVENYDIDEIYGNTISNSFSGIILESNENNYDSANAGEELDAYDPPGLATNHTKIYNNFLTNLSDTGIGLARINVDEITNNFGSNMTGFIHSFNSIIGLIEGNMASGNLTDDGIKFYSTSASGFKRNQLNGFDTGLEVSESSTVSGGINNSWFQGGVYGVRFENSNLNSITNSLFTNNEYGIYGGTSTSGYSLRNSSFYNQSRNAVNQSTDIAGGIINIENTAFSKVAGTVVDLRTSLDLGTVDYNVYDNALGSYLLEDSSSSLDFSGLQALGYEAKGLYQDSGDLFPNAGANSFYVNPGSLAMNSANDALGIVEDFWGNVRPVCGASDRGAWESQDGTDVDNDGLCVEQEAAYGTLDTVNDSDSDGLEDGEEVYTYGTDLLDADTDNDLLEDGEEVSTYSSDPNDTDSDDDLLSDYDEALTHGTDLDNEDTDADTFSDYEEVTSGSDPLDASSTPDSMDDDSDGLSNSEESVLGTDPLDSDSDNDGLLDGEEVDTYGSDPLLTDTDADGLEDNEEVSTYGTDPALADTDADSFEDYEEILGGSDPLDATSTPDTLDDDGDGLSNTAEGILGTDPADTDSDNDGLSDGEEVYTYGSDPLLTDSDSDSLSDYDEVVTYGTDAASSDTDLDGLSDGEEVLTYGTDALDADTDADALDDGAEISTYGTDPNDADSDADGLMDGLEITLGADPLNTDSDGDSLTDGDEVSTYGTDPTLADTDSDTLSDSTEIGTYGTDPLDADTDGDTYNDNDEISAGSDPLDALSTPGTLDTDGDGLTYDEETVLGTDPLDADTDDDTLSDYEEANIYLTNPLSSDSDSDSLTDYEELVTYGTDPNVSDSDGDTYSDSVEITAGSDPLDASSTPGTLDTDADGLTYDEEIVYGTDPADSDSDDDTLSDGAEITAGTDPLSSDSDADGLSDSEEVTYGTDPNVSDTDGDSYDDYTEVLAGSDPMDATSDPTTAVDTDADGLTDYNENTLYGTDPNDSDSDDDDLSDYEEVITYGTDANDNDTDSDGFRDDYEISQSTDANDSSSTPYITVYGVGYRDLTGYSGVSTSYTSYDSDSMTIGTTLEHEVATSGYGALGLRWNTDAFLGTLTVTYCGAQVGSWTGSEYDSAYASASCTEVEDYTTAYGAGTHNTTATSVTDSSQLEVWSYLSSYYTYGDWSWYRTPYTTTSNRYHLFRIQLNP